ncbi:hypothetical protein ACFLQX_01785, partial [Bacteroidota bacterium]
MSKSCSNYLKLILLWIPFHSISLQAQFVELIAEYETNNLEQVNEQVYIHSDCEVYAPGDTIWVKAYVRNKHTLDTSNLSKVFYLYLATESGAIFGEEKLLIQNSQASGYMLVESNFGDGYYTLLGYSSWMKNFGPEQVFSKRIQILEQLENDYRLLPHFNKQSYLPGDTVKVLVRSYDEANNIIERSRFRYRFLVDGTVLERGATNTRETESSPLSFVMSDTLETQPVLHIWDDYKDVRFDVPLYADIFIDFFPEGGQCLVNELSNMAFKAAYTNGKAAAIEGSIVDEDGTVLSQVQSEHQGMGRFAFSPAVGKKYYLKINQPAGYDQLYQLPEAREEAWTIQAQNAHNKINVIVLNNLAHFDTCLFNISIRGHSSYYKLIPSESQTTFSVPSESFPAGVAVLTLMDKNRLPLAERLIFVNKERAVSANISTNRSRYLPRDAVSLSIEMSNENFSFENGHYSLSVYDDIFGGSEFIDESNIVSSFYLSPEIKGKIIDPNYYFDTNSRSAAYHLDLLLMTQGWRSYKYLKKEEENASIVLPENQDVIKGWIERFKFGRDPLPTAGKILIYFAGSSETIATDTSGHFSFYPEYTPSHTSPIMVAGSDDKGSDQVFLYLNHKDYRDSLNSFLIEYQDSTESQTASLNYLYEDIKREYRVFSDKSIWLEEVEVKGGIDEEYEDPEIGMLKSFESSKSPSKDLLESSAEILDVVQTLGYYSYLEESDSGILLRVHFRGEKIAAKFIVDGMDKGFNYQSINAEYSPAIMKNMYVAAGFQASLVYNAGVVIYIETDEDKYRELLHEKKVRNSKTVEGLQIVKEFYNPQYRTEEERNFPMPDTRKTIHWNPYVDIDENGKANITFF